jgi:hypothetical protein
LVTGHVEEGAAAAFGGLAGFSAPESPYRYRARLVAGVGVGLVASVFLGTLAASQGWVAALTAGGTAGLASFVCQAAELLPPRELMLLMTVLAATDQPATAETALERAILTAGGAVIAWGVTMAPALRRGRRPEVRAMSAAYEAVAGLLDATGTPAAAVARHTAVQRFDELVSPQPRRAWAAITGSARPS